MFNVYATQAMNGEGFTMREPTPIFLETVVSANEATLDEFRALGYTGVFAVPVSDLATQADAEKQEKFLFPSDDEGAHKTYVPPQPAPAIEWPSGFENPEEWEKTVAEQSQREAKEAEEQAALLKSFQDEVNEEETETGHSMENAEGEKALYEKTKKEQGE